MPRIIAFLAGIAAIAAAVSATLPAAAGEPPTEVRFAAILSTGIENAWDRSWVKSFERVQAAKPHGLEMKLQYTEGVWGDQAEAVMRAYAESGNVDIVFANSSYSDQVENLKDEFPEIMWVVSGSGNRGLGGNAYWVAMHAYEPAYLMGIIAGKMTKSDVIGVVGLFPADDVNDQINAFFDGAKSVNPGVKQKVTFIESWYDPAKSQEAANAQVAAGADFIFQLGEAFEVCKSKSIVCFGNYDDLSSMAPEVIATSALATWDPTIVWLVDQWYAHKADGKPYDAPREPVWFHMAENGADLAPYHEFEGKLPADVKKAVAEAKAAILAGTLEVPFDISMPKSD